MSRRVRVDMMIALLLAALALVAAVLSNRAPPKQDGGLTWLPTPAPTVTATPGWWGDVAPGPYRLGPMPTLPSAGR